MKGWEGIENPKLCASAMEKLYEACMKSTNKPSFVQIPERLANLAIKEIGQEAFNDWLNDEGVFNEI